MDQFKFVKFTWKIQILHEEVDLLPLAGEVDLIVLVPLGEVGLAGQEPDRVELLLQQDVAPDGETQEHGGHHQDDNFHRFLDDDIGDGFEDTL